MKTILSLLVVAAIVVAIILFGGSSDSNQTLSPEESAEVVAIAGEEEITRGEVQRAFAAFQQNPQAQQITEDQVITQLVNQKLLYQKAVKSGVSLKKTDLDAAYDQVVANFGSESALEDELGFSAEEFREFLEEQLITQEYVNTLREDFDANVSEADIQEAFDQFAAQAEEEITLEEVEASIIQFLEEQAFQQELAEQIEELQDEFVVEIIIDEELTETEVEESSEMESDSMEEDTQENSEEGVE
jgi:hypothetical protein